MSYLLDTNVVSELRRPRPHANVVAWLDSVEPARLYLSVLTLGELAQGIARRRRRDPVAADSLERWRLGIVELFADRLIGIDAAVAAVWGELNAERPLPVVDSLLAATANVHGLTLVTRNVRDVEGTGVALLDPWDEAAP